VTPDAGWLAQIHGASFCQPRPWGANEFERLLASPGAILITREHGFLLARLAADEAEVLTMAVSPDARRRGTGRAMLAELEENLISRDASRLFLEVSQDNAAALALYYSCGLTESGRRSGYYSNSNGAASDALILSKIIAQRAKPSH